MSDPMDIQKMMQEAAAKMQLDPSRVQELFKSQAEMGGKFSQLALSAAEKSAELSAKFTQETLAKLGDLTKARETPQDYGQAMQAFASSQSEAVQGQVAAFAQIVREVQSQTVELMMQAARDAQEKGVSAMKPGGGKSGKG